MAKSLEDISNLANKRYGQNFLKDKMVLNKIIEAMPKDDLKIVEIGPGLGDLTRQLLEVGPVKAYEVDKRLCQYLIDEFKEEIKSGKLELICKDVLSHKGPLEEKRYKLIANLPYNIATNIILNSLRDRNCEYLLVMVQKEVAQKFAAKSKDKNFGSLAILAQSIADVNIISEVDASSFVPPPKVTSALLEIKKRSSLEDKGFEEFLKIATKQPRKTLLKNLSTSYKKEYLRDIFNTLNIPLNIRAHELELSVYHHLYNLIKDKADERREESNTKSTKESNSTNTKGSNS